MEEVKEVKNEEWKEENKDFRCGTVAIIGPPNAGKSTLLNLFLGHKISIVTPKPQTTRNRIAGILTHDDAQIIFLDTPGIHDAKEVLNKFLVETAWQALEGCDLVLLILDSSKYVNNLSRLDKDLEVLKGPILEKKFPFAVVLNKIDLVKAKHDLLPIIDFIRKTLGNDIDVFLISALKGEETDTLLKYIKEKMPISPPLYPKDQVSNVPLRFMAAEIIREKLYLFLHQELPYSVAVIVENWEEDPSRNLVLINAVIFVAKKNHKQIVIGRNGSMLKKIGKEARLELEALLGKKVYLELWVKVKPKWNEDINFLSQLNPDYYLI